MLYCTFEALDELIMDLHDFVFVTKHGKSEETITFFDKSVDFDTCFKDGIGAAEHKASLICEYGKFEFGYTRYTVDIDNAIQLSKVVAGKKEIAKYLNNNGVIMCLEEEADNLDTVAGLYVLEAVKENKGIKQEAVVGLDDEDETYTIEEIKSGLKKKEFAILPLEKKEDKLIYKGIVIGKAEKYEFYKTHCPTLYYDIAKILESCVEVPDDFTKFKYCVVEITQLKDRYENELVKFILLRELTMEELIQLDSTGKSHLFIVSNYSNVDVTLVTDSLKELCNVGKKKVEPKLLLEYLKQANLTDISWIEDYLIKYSDYAGNDALVKILKNCKKIANFDKVFKYLCYNARFSHSNIISALKGTKTFDVVGFQDEYIKLVKNDLGDLSDFVEAFSKIKLDKIKEELLKQTLKQDKSCYYLISLFKSAAYDKVELLNELLEKTKGQNSFILSLSHCLQDYIRENKFEKSFVDAVMQLLFTADKTGKQIYDISNHSYYNFYRYDSDISAYYDRLERIVRNYRSAR